MSEVLAMPRKTRTVESTEAFYELLQGPMGIALRATGVILVRELGVDR